MKLPRLPLRPSFPRPKSDEPWAWSAGGDLGPSWAWGRNIYTLCERSGDGWDAIAQIVEVRSAGTPKTHGYHLILLPPTYVPVCVFDLGWLGIIEVKRLAVAIIQEMDR